MKTAATLLSTFLLSFLFVTSISAQDAGISKAKKIIGPEKGDRIVGQVKNIIYPSVKPQNKEPQHVETTTVFQEIQQLSKPQQGELATVVNQQIATTPTNNYYYPFWNTFGTILDRCDNGVYIGRTYGDPHIQTFDGYKYDLQSVGEFVLCRSADGNFEVQTRQAVVNPKMSMNSACAIKMVGDVVSIEAAPYPTMSNQIVRVNGEEIVLRINYTTPRGILIRKKENVITVHSPLGEKVMVKPLGTKGRFFSVVPTIVRGSNVEYEGLLGNADGKSWNDLRVNGRELTAHPSFYTPEDLENGGQVSNATANAEKANQKMIALDFGHHWRITDETSLFTYSKGKSTDSYTDLSYPREYATISDHDEDAVRKAQMHCKNAGVSAANMQGCMSDVLLTGDPRATKYTTAINNQKVVETLDIRNEVLSARQTQTTTKDIKAARKEINKAESKEARARWWNEHVVTPTRTTSPTTTTQRTSTTSKPATKPVYRPATKSAAKPVYRPAPKPVRQTSTRTTSKPRTSPNASRSSGSGAKKVSGAKR